MLLPINHPAQLHLSAFVHEIHNALSLYFPEVRAIPAPQVVVLKKNEMDLFAVNSSYCIPLKIIPKNVVSKDTHDGLWASYMAGHFLGSEDLRTECGEDIEHRPDLVNALIAAINKSQPGCPVVKNGEHFSIIGTSPSANCSQAPISDNIAYGGSFVRGSGNVIFVSSGVIKSSEERHVEAALAHELAHYYLAHGNVAQHPIEKRENLLNYFFRVTDYVNHSIRPTPDNSSETISLQRELDNADMHVEPFIPGMKLHKDTILRTAIFFEHTSGLSFLPRNVIDPMRGSCSPLRVELGNFKKYARISHSTFDGLRWERDPDTARKVDFLAQRCMNSMSTFTFAELYKWAAAAGAAGDIEYYARYERNILAATLQDSPQFPPNGRLEELLMSYNAQRVSRENKARQLARRAQEFGLGWYTFENEADQMSVHLLALVDRVPAAALESFFASAGKWEDVVADDFAYAPSLNDCRKAYLNNWKDWQFRNKPWVPYFGRFDSPHPSFCFRIYDVDTESRLFDSIFAGRTPLRNSSSWLNVQQQLRSE
jgi:hypothetical protein